MKKQITVLFLALFYFFLHPEVSSQTLFNSSWKVFDNTSVFYTYFHFSADTLSYSGDNVFYTKVSKYQESINSFTVIDIGSSSSCPPNTPGTYTFTIQNDTLKFTLLNDICPFRHPVFATYYWVRSLTGIQELNINNDISIYPNPANDFIKITGIQVPAIKSITVLGIDGKVLDDTVLPGNEEEIQINISNFNSGLYFIKLNTSRGFVTKKIIKN